MIKKDILFCTFVGLIILPLFIIPFINDYSDMFLRNGFDIFKFTVFKPTIFLYASLRWIGASYAGAWFILLILWGFLTALIGIAGISIMRKK